jgi:hypothetical protein
MKRLAFLAMMVAIAACAAEGTDTDSATVADSASATMDSAHMAQMRADSIRADSLRKDSVAKGLIDTSKTK